jgi:predicted Zn-dependent protease
MNLRIPLRVRALFGTLALALLAALPACESTQTGRSYLALISREEAAQMGEQAFRELTADPATASRIVRSGPAFQQVDRITRRMVDVARKDEPSFSWEWVVIDEPQTVNAFCLPGGKIAVYTGIIPVAKSDDELAAVIGHEIAHATNHHGQKRVSQAMREGLISEVIGGAAGMSGEETQILAGALGVVGSSFDDYSRDDETESDIVGLRYLIEAGYDPEGAVRFWQNMVELSGPSESDWMATHPANERRVANLKKAIEIYRTQGAEAWKFEHYN